MRVSSSSFVLTRRHLLAALGAGMIADAATAAPDLPRREPRARGRQMKDAGIDEWAALVGERFGLGAGLGAGLRLIAVEPAGERASRTHRRPFTAVFEAAGPGGPEGDRAYRLSHPAIAPLPVFLGPAAAAGGRMRLVAEFG